MKNTLKLWALMLFAFNIHAQCWQAISISDFMATGIKTDGTLWEWGYFYSGSTGTTLYYPVQVGSDTDWKSVSTGRNHRAAIKNNGTLWTWGHISSLGLGNITYNITQPTQAGTDTDWKSVDCHNAPHTLAIKENGTLWGWGVNYQGAVGVPSMPSDPLIVYIPTQIGTDTDWKFATVAFKAALPIGYFWSYSMAIKNDNSLWVWGDNSFGQLGLPTGLSTLVPTHISTMGAVASISSSAFNTHAIKTDGTLWACGNNSWGELGDGTTISKTSFTQIGTENSWNSVSSGENHTILIKTDGTLWACGNNYYGALGTGNNVDSLVPVQIGSGTDWVEVSASIDKSQALKTNETLWSFGANYSYGVLGIGPNITFRNYPSQVLCNSLDTETYISENINIYPNPVQDILSFEFNQNSNVKKLIIYDLLGKKVIEQNDNSYGEIYIGELKPGIYLMKIYVDDTIYQQKFIKE